MNENLSVQTSNTKLEKFKEIVLADALELKEKILNEILEQKKQALAAAEITISNEIKVFLDEENEKLNNKQKQVLSKENFDGKKSLLIKRDQVIGSVFKEVKGKLAEFCKSIKYKDYLIQKTKEAKEKLGENDVEIFLKQDDIKYMGDIKNTWGNNSKCNVVTSNTIELGGLMFSSTGALLIIDETFDSKIFELQRDFIKISGLYFG